MTCLAQVAVFLISAIVAYGFLHDSDTQDGGPS